MCMIIFDSHNNPMKLVGILVHFKGEKKFEAQEAEIAHWGQVVKKVSGAQVQILKLQPEGCSPYTLPANHFKGRSG